MSDRVVVVLDRNLANALHHADTADEALSQIEHEVVAALDRDPDELVEQVAEAIHQAEWLVHPPGGRTPLAELSSDDQRKVAHRQARAAIAALTGKGKD